MKREDLFLAIGEVEERRLERSEQTGSPSNVIHLEEKNMKNKKVNPSRVVRNLLIAAVIVSMLGVTALAVGGFLIFDTPEEMLASVFGDNTGFDHSDGSITHDPWGGPEAILVEPTFDRVPVDETMVEDMADIVELVGQSISWYGYTLTVDAHMYDAATQCGLVTYTLENPDGIKPYELQTDGEIYFPGGELVYINQHCNNYIIQEKSSDTKLAIACYYQYDSQNVGENLELTFYTWAAVSREEGSEIFTELVDEMKQTVSQQEAYDLIKQGLSEEEFEQLKEMMSDEEIVQNGYSELAQKEFDKLYRCPDVISIAVDRQGELKSITFGDGAVTVSGIAMRIDGGKLDKSNVDNVTVCYADGTEYVVHDGYLINYTQALWSENVLTYNFNRIIDVDSVVSVVIDGTELPID